jgi:hypothetical protein
MGSPPRSESMGAIQKIGLKYGLNYQQHSRLHHSITHTRYSEWTQLAIGFADVDAAHRQRTVTLGAERLSNFIKKRSDTPFTFLNVVDTYSINTRCSLPRSHTRPRRFKYIPTKDAIIQSVKPKRRLSLGLAAQFPSQKGDFNWHARLGAKPLCHPFRNGALSAQAAHPFFDGNMTEVWPLRSIPFPGLPHYYGPLRLPAAAVMQVMDSPQTVSTTLVADSTPGLPGSSTNLSTRALPNHPGRSNGCVCSLLPRRWQASSPPEGWPPPFTCNEAGTGSLALGLTSSLSRDTLSPLPQGEALGDRPTSHGWLPSHGRPQLHAERAIDMSDTFQSDRLARLGLANRRARSTTSSKLQKILNRGHTQTSADMKRVS